MAVLVCVGGAIAPEAVVVGAAAVCGAAVAVWGARAIARWVLENRHSPQDELGLDKGQRRRLHDRITKRKLSIGRILDQIEELWPELGDAVGRIRDRIGRRAK